MSFIVLLFHRSRGRVVVSSLCLSAIRRWWILDRCLHVSSTRYCSNSWSRCLTCASFSSSSFRFSFSGRSEPSSDPKALSALASVTKVVIEPPPLVLSFSSCCLAAAACLFATTLWATPITFSLYVSSSSKHCFCVTTAMTPSTLSPQWRFRVSTCDILTRKRWRSLASSIRGMLRSRPRDGSGWDDGGSSRSCCEAERSRVAVPRPAKGGA